MKRPKDDMFAPRTLHLARLGIVRVLLSPHGTSAEDFRRLDRQDLARDRAFEARRKKMPSASMRTASPSH